MVIGSRVGQRITQFTKMHIQKIIENNQRNSEILDSVSAEIKAIKKELIIRKKKALLLENEELKRKIERTCTQLIAVEIKNGKRQIAIPGTTRNMCTNTQNIIIVKPEAHTNPAQEKTQAKEKSKKEKLKDEKSAPEVEVIDVSRLDMRIGKIVECTKHPDADSLYLEKIDCGESHPRTVVSGLVKYVPLSEMQNRMVVVLCNLKPAKMRGVLSEAMVMCASTPEKVEILSPPSDAVPGDLVHCEGYVRNPDAQMNPKKKIFETCAPDLKTNSEMIACYKDAVLTVPGKGNIVAQTLKNVQVK